MNESECDVYMTAEEAAIVTTGLYILYKQVVVAGLIPVIALFGILSNGAFLFVVHRVQEMRTITNVYLCNLAISDTIVLIVGSIHSINTYFDTPIDYTADLSATWFGCVIPIFTINLCYFASVYLITLVTFERFLALCHPIKHHLIKGPWWTARMIFVAWMLALAMACFTVRYDVIDYICVSWPDKEDSFYGLSPRFSVCTSHCPWCWKVFQTLDYAQFIISCVCSLGMYFNIIFTLSTRKGIHHSQSKTVERTRNQIARMLILNGTVFFLCLAPYELINFDAISFWLTNYRFFTKAQQQYILWIGRLATLLNSAVNPILYSITNEPYRKAFADVFGCRGRRSQRANAKHKQVVLSISRITPV